MPDVIDSGVAYLALKAAQKIYGKIPDALQPAEFERVQNMAQQQHELETRVLAAPEARDAMVPPATLQAAMQEIRGRYPNEDDFADDLARNGLDEAGFADALERELKVEAILEKVATRAANVSDIERWNANSRSKPSWKKSPRARPTSATSMSNCITSTTPTSSAVPRHAWRATSSSPSTTPFPRTPAMPHASASLKSPCVCRRNQVVSKSRR